MSTSANMHRQIIGKVHETSVYLICDRDRLIELDLAGEEIVATEIVSAREAVSLQMKEVGNLTVLEAMWPSQRTRAEQSTKRWKLELGLPKARCAVMASAFAHAGFDTHMAVKL